MKPKYQLSIALIFMIITLMFISFIFGVHSFDQEQLAINARAEGLIHNEISRKVRHIMSLYNCNDNEIYQAIMESFDPVLTAIIIAIESEYRHDVVSEKNCRGLMQLSPDKLEDWRNKTENIRIGSAYLETQLKRFGDWELAVAAYNCGPEDVVKYGGVPPYKETEGYITQLRQWVWYIYGTGAMEGIDIVKLTRGNAKKGSQMNMDRY